MNLRRKVKGIPLIVLVLSSIIVVGAIGQAVTGGWVLNLTDPSPPTGGEIEDTIVITELLEFLQVVTTVTGSGEYGTLHDVDISITNIGTNGDILDSGSYMIGFEPSLDPTSDEIVAQGIAIGILNPTDEHTASYTWTPTSIDSYRGFSQLYTLIWSTP